MNNSRMERNAQRRLQRGNVFVAYPYCPRGRQIVDTIIAPALTHNGLKAFTLNHLPEQELVLTLASQIDRCTAMVGVTIGRSPNVFFEIGLAAAKAKPCMLIGDDFDDFAMLKGAYSSILLKSDADPIATLTDLLRRMT